MMLCLDVGNSHVYGGVFDGDEISLRFRHASKERTSDELGLFLKQVLRENQCEPDKITKISIGSVVPQLDYSLRSACIKYFSIDPFFLQAGVKTGLNIKYRNPIEVGADRIADAIGATHRFPGQSLIMIDFGTATTFCVVNSKKAYLGGAILPGLKLSMEALSSNTAKLPAVDIVRVTQVVGRSTVESIQSGIYFGALGAVKEVIERIKKQIFLNEEVLVLATGGFAGLFEKENIYHYLLPDLVLEGLRLAIKMNES
ncbi:MAG: type III pantothenate kinase [Legionellaceae bacterium]|nr:type III pantothenate kinase [Legionellaceae bacterium]